MKTRIILSVLGFACLLSCANCQCDLSGKQQDVEFPDIKTYVALSYIMGVEYSTPFSAQTDYYTEYYDAIENRGRVESHISSENKVYIYVADTWEAWILENKKCNLKNTTEHADFLKHNQTDWLHYGESETPKMPTTIGPSAMLKNAYDSWNKTEKDRKMAYMGSLNTLIRGEKVIYWRRCMDNNAYADYFFADPEEENPEDSDALKRNVPIRVAFYGVSTDSKYATQFYDFISFHRFIPPGFHPFELPKGKNCGRGPLVDGAVLPDFSNNNILLSAEVVYKRYSKAIDGSELMASYYSTLMFALDREMNHLAYYYSDWNTTKPDKDNTETILNAPKYVIFDMQHEYQYIMDYETGKCEIARSKSFVPQYKLPEGGGNLDFTDPNVLLPHKELKFLSEGTNRGLAVNIFEAEKKKYKLGKDTEIPRVIFSNSYLKSNEELENTVAVRYAPTQMELHLFRDNDIEEYLTLNVFGFTTRIPGKRYLFDVTPCFKNDDDYLFLSIGFEIENRLLKDIPNVLPQIEGQVVEEITGKSELNAARMPAVMTDMKDNYVYVTIMILGKPDLQLDFPNPETDKSVVVGSTDDTQGISDFNTCANNCLEKRFDCWGFSVCGNTCYYGSGTNTKIEDKKDCKLYRRYTNETFMPSKERQAENIRNMVEKEEFRVMVVINNDQRETLTATSAQVTDPAEDDSLFEKMGNLLNPRMRVLKAATKLKQGSKVKNLGKLRYDECQSLCLDFKNCETISYCLVNSECKISEKYGTDLKESEMVSDELCNLLTRKYTDHFDRAPGVFVTVKGGTKLELPNIEDCSRACLKHDKFKCLSFDYCSGREKNECTLYGVHFLNPKDRKEVQGKNPSCGHYTRKYSTEFKRKDETRVSGSKIPPIMNLTLEECAKSCVVYGEGTCYGYDFCQGNTLLETSCILFDTDPSRLQTSYSPICTNYARTEPEYAPRPFTNSYAGGIGFLCFVIGGILGAIVVFAIAYIRVNRR